jgi:hypothetical protein
VFGTAGWASGRTASAAQSYPATQERKIFSADRPALAGREVFRFLEQNRAVVQGMETGKDRFARFRDHLDRLVDLLAGPDAPLRDRVRATTAVLFMGATCMFYLQQVDDPDKLGAVILEIATDMVS